MSNRLPHAFSHPRIVAALAVVLLAACSDRSVDLTTPVNPEPNALSADVTTSNGLTIYRGEEVYPLPPVMAVPCGPNGAVSDMISVTGDVHYRWQFSVDEQGSLRSHDISVTHAARGVSLWTGVEYRVPQTNRVVDIQADRQVGSNVMRLSFIGAGPENNFVIESHSLWNFAPDGSVQVWFSDYTFVCHTDGA